ncbi:MAG: hypothetical protein PHG27_09795, partial [Massilibacteroides sp.]|nr:hypothetical protein [Massilibacteroides sp.]
MSALYIRSAQGELVPITTIKGDPGVSPKVQISVLGYKTWWVYDDTMQTFVDTEVRAEAVVQIEDGIITFTEAPTRTNIDSGDTMSTVLGKIRKWLANLKGLAFKDSVSYDEITGDKPPIFGLPSTTNDWVAIFKSTGFSIWYRISVYPDANTFAARTTGGQLMVGNAILDDAAVPLAQVKQLIADLVNGSPEALDTLQ